MIRFFFFALLVALFPAFLGCSSAKELVYQDMRNFRVKSVSFQQAVFAMDLKFYNPNSFGLSLKNGDIDAFVNDHYLGKGLLDERIQIPARDTFLLPVSFQVGLTDLLGSAMGMLGSSSQEILLRMQGSVRAGKGGVFLPVPVHYEGKQRIQL